MFEQLVNEQYTNTFENVLPSVKITRLKMCYYWKCATTKRTIVFNFHCSSIHQIKLCVKHGLRSFLIDHLQKEPMVHIIKRWLIWKHNYVNVVYIKFFCSSYTHTHTHLYHKTGQLSENTWVIVEMNTMVILSSTHNAQNQVCNSSYLIWLLFPFSGVCYTSTRTWLMVAVYIF